MTVVRATGKRNKGIGTMFDLAMKAQVRWRYHNTPDISAILKVGASLSTVTILRMARCGAAFGKWIDHMMDS